MILMNIENFKRGYLKEYNVTQLPLYFVSDDWFPFVPPETHALNDNTHDSCIVPIQCK